MIQISWLVLTYSPQGIQAGGEGAGCVAWFRVSGGASRQVGDKRSKRESNHECRNKHEGSGTRRVNEVDFRKKQPSMEPLESA